MFGIYGLGVVTVLLAALPALAATGGGRHPARPVRRCWPVAAAGFGVLALWLAGAVRLVGATGEVVPGVRLRLVQASIPQSLKWDAAARERILARHLELGASAPASGAAPPTHILWPETAAPYLLADWPRRVPNCGPRSPRRSRRGARS